MSQSTTLEKLDGLKRRIDISVPANEVEQAYQQKIKKVSKTAKVDGFRPGKVPTAVVEDRFGKNILIETAQELIQSSLVKAVEEHHLHIVGHPSVTPKEIKRGQPFEYLAEFEVYPEIKLADMSTITVTRPVLDLTDANIDKMLETLQKQHADWQEVNRASKKSDQIEIDFEGFLDGKRFDRGSAEHFKLELGSQKMIPGFEDQLLGVHAGEERDIECTFPEEYPNKELSAQKIMFKVKVHKVMEAKLPEINDEFAKRIGIENGILALREEVEKNMRSQVSQILKDKVKLLVMDKLLALNDISVPEALINAEIDNLKEMMKQNVVEKAKNKKINDDMLPPHAYFEKQAKRRVTLGLLLGEVIKQNELKADRQKVREKIEQIASVYHDPAQVVNWYYDNKQMFSEVESVVLEDQAVEKILQSCQVEDKKIGYEEAIKAPQEDSK